MKETDFIVKAAEGNRAVLNSYIGILQDTDPHKIWEVNGNKLNSQYWLVGHLAWAENMLCVQSSGGKVVDIDWLNEFKIGSKPENMKFKASYPEVLEAFHEIHAKSMEYIKNLAPEKLDETNAFNFSMMNEKNVRVLLYHHLRHEGTHIGQFGWLCKFNGITTF